MGIWKKLFGRKSVGAEHCRTFESSGDESPTLVVLSDEDMDFFRRHGGTVERMDTAARKYLGQGKYDDSFRCCRILSLIDPNQPGPWLECGVALYEKDAATWRALPSSRFSASKPPPHDAMCEAVRCFDRVLELDRQNHLAWYYKGSSLAMIGQFTRDASQVKRGLDCFSQALQTRPGDDATKKAIRDFRNIYATLQDPSKRLQEAEALCDVCSYPINFTDGYSLTTEQVVPTVPYWEVALKGQFQALLSDDQKSAAALGQLVARQASQNTGWLVCEACADLFEFDRATAKEYARKRMNPPNVGPLADPKKALAAAFAAKLKLKEAIGA